MFKRLVWMGTGAAFGAVAGAGATMWADYKARRALSRLAPDSVGRRFVSRSGAWGSNVQEAWREGRRAMREREDELRRQLLGETPAPPASVITIPADRPQRRRSPHHPSVPGQRASILDGSWTPTECDAPSLTSSSSAAIGNSRPRG